MTANDRKFMQAAIAVSRKSRNDPTGAIPRVGAVAVVDDEIVAEAYRGEIESGQHAEYILLEKHLADSCLVEATVYTTLEPCTRRGEGKIPCVERLITRKVGHVVIGMLDPNPIVRGLGFRELRRANVRTEVFPFDLMAEVEDINRDFVRAIEGNPIHRATEEIARLAVRGTHPLQRAASEHSLGKCLDTLRRIERGQVPIDEKEAGYFQRWLERIENFEGTERVKAYIRLVAFDPTELLTKNWFNEFYARLRVLVEAGKLTIQYVFLLGTTDPTPGTVDFLDGFKDFADEIRVVHSKGDHLTPDQLRPSIVLFQNQRTAFTHDRGDNAVLTEADEWFRPSDYDRLSKRYATLELASSVYFRR